MNFQSKRDSQRNQIPKPVINRPSATRGASSDSYRTVQSSLSSLQNSQLNHNQVSKRAHKPIFDESSNSIKGDIENRAPFFTPASSNKAFNNSAAGLDSFMTCVDINNNTSRLPTELKVHHPNLILKETETNIGYQDQNARIPLQDVSNIIKEQVLNYTHSLFSSVNQKSSRASALADEVQRKSINNEQQMKFAVSQISDLMEQLELVKKNSTFGNRNHLDTRNQNINFQNQISLLQNQQRELVQMLHNVASQLQDDFNRSMTDILRPSTEKGGVQEMIDQANREFELKMKNKFSELNYQMRNLEENSRLIGTSREGMEEQSYSRHHEGNQEVQYSNIVIDLRSQVQYIQAEVQQKVSTKEIKEIFSEIAEEKIQKNLEPLSFMESRVKKLLQTNTQAGKLENLEKQVTTFIEQTDHQLEELIFNSSQKWKKINQCEYQIQNMEQDFRAINEWHNQLSLKLNEVTETQIQREAQNNQNYLQVKTKFESALQNTQVIINTRTIRVDSFVIEKLEAMIEKLNQNINQIEHSKSEQFSFLEGQLNQFKSSLQEKLYQLKLQHTEKFSQASFDDRSQAYQSNFEDIIKQQFQNVSNSFDNLGTKIQQAKQFNETTKNNTHQTQTSNQDIFKKELPVQVQRQITFFGVTSPENQIADKAAQFQFKNFSRQTSDSTSPRSTKITEIEFKAKNQSNEKENFNFRSPNRDQLYGSTLNSNNNRNALSSYSHSSKQISSQQKLPFTIQDEAQAFICNKQSFKVHEILKHNPNQTYNSNSNRTAFQAASTSTSVSSKSNYPSQQQFKDENNLIDRSKATSHDQDQRITFGFQQKDNEIKQPSVINDIQNSDNLMTQNQSQLRSMDQNPSHLPGNNPNLQNNNPNNGQIDDWKIQDIRGNQKQHYLQMDHWRRVSMESANSQNLDEILDQFEDYIDNNSASCAETDADGDVFFYPNKKTNRSVQKEPRELQLKSPLMQIDQIGYTPAIVQESHQEDSMVFNERMVKQNQLKSEWNDERSEIDNQYLELRARIKNLIAQSNPNKPLDCQVDQAGYMKNNTGCYVFDVQGLLIKLNQFQIQQLCNENLINLL